MCHVFKRVILLIDDGAFLHLQDQTHRVVIFLIIPDDINIALISIEDRLPLLNLLNGDDAIADSGSFFKLQVSGKRVHFLAVFIQHFLVASLKKADHLVHDQHILPLRDLPYAGSAALPQLVIDTGFVKDHLPNGNLTRAISDGEKPFKAA